MCKISDLPDIVAYQIDSRYDKKTITLTDLNPESLLKANEYGIKGWYLTELITDIGKKSGKLIYILTYTKIKNPG